MAAQVATTPGENLPSSETAAHNGVLGSPAEHSEIDNVDEVNSSTSLPDPEDRLSSSESPEPSEEANSAEKKWSKAADSAAPSANGEVPANSSKGDSEVKGSVPKTKKKEDKSIEYILRALSSLNSPEEKLAALCKKYADLHEEHRVLQYSFKQQQRKMTVVTREKDQLQAEHIKAIMAKSKLESLCRELQKQNKAVKEESLVRAKEEEEKRKAISTKFQTTIEEIQAQMTDNHEKNSKLREENLDMAGRLKKFLEQHQLREQQLEKMMKHRELEQQLADAKLEQAAAVLREEKATNIKEKELLLLQASESQKRNSALELQLGMYKERYEEFQVTINKSNDMFQKLKSEMDKMGKRIKKLEKEGAAWRAKWETSNQALVNMSEQKTRSDKEKDVLQTKVGRLESLCRALQAELHTSKSPSLPLGDPAPISAGLEPALGESTVDTSLPSNVVADPPPPATSPSSLTDACSGSPPGAVSPADVHPASPVSDRQCPSSLPASPDSTTDPVSAAQPPLDSQPDLEDEQVTSSTGSPSSEASSPPPGSQLHPLPTPHPDDPVSQADSTAPVPDRASSSASDVPEAVSEKVSSSSADVPAAEADLSSLASGPSHSACTNAEQS